MDSLIKICTKDRDAIANKLKKMCQEWNDLMKIVNPISEKRTALWNELFNIFEERQKLIETLCPEDEDQKYLKLKELNENQTKKLNDLDVIDTKYDKYNDVKKSLINKIKEFKNKYEEKQLELKQMHINKKFNNLMRLNECFQEKNRELENANRIKDETLSQAQKKYDYEIQQLKNKFAKKAKDTKELKDDNKIKVEILSRVQEKFDKYDNEIKNLKNDLSKKEEDIKRLQNSNRIKDEILSRVQKLHDEYEKEIQDLKGKLSKKNYALCYYDPNKSYDIQKRSYLLKEIEELEGIQCEGKERYLERHCVEENQKARMDKELHFESLNELKNSLDKELSFTQLCFNEMNKIYEETLEKDKAMLKKKLTELDMQYKQVSHTNSLLGKHLNEKVDVIKMLERKNLEIQIKLRKLENNTTPFSQDKTPEDSDVIESSNKKQRIS